jgi:hypothetical protein
MAGIDDDDDDDDDALWVIGRPSVLNECRWTVTICSRIPGTAQIEKRT